MGVILPACTTCSLLATATLNCYLIHDLRLDQVLLSMHGFHQLEYLAGGQHLRDCPPAKDNTGVCGEMAGRGTCTNLNLNLPPLGSDFTHTTVRDNWPYYYTRVCSCNGNYAGFDCSRCKYGYYGDNCSQKVVLPRRPVSNLTNEEWVDYIAILKLAKDHDSGYFVFVEEPASVGTDVTTLQKTVVKLYDLFTWQHHYAAKDNERSELQN